MQPNFKRPKVLYGSTPEVITPCGKLYLTFNYIDEEKEKLVEVRGHFGKAGTCSLLGLDSICKLISILLQSPLSRKKIISKIRKGWISTDKKERVTCGNPYEYNGVKYQSCIEMLMSLVVDELE